MLTFCWVLSSKQDEKVSKLYVWNGDSTHFNKLVSLYVQILTKPKQKSYIQKFYNLNGALLSFSIVNKLYINWPGAFDGLCFLHFEADILRFGGYLFGGSLLEGLVLWGSRGAATWGPTLWPDGLAVLFCLYFVWGSMIERISNQLWFIYGYNFFGVGKRMGRFRYFSIFLFEMSKYDIKSIDRW